MPKFKCITDEGLDFAKANSEALLAKIKESPNDNSWLDEFFKKYKFKSTNYEIDIEFKADSKDPYKHDYENAIIFFETLNSLNLGKAFIYNEKFIVSFALQNAYKYFASFEIKSLDGTLFFVGGKRRSIARNLIARLYLLVSLSLSEEEKNKYKYTKHVLSNPGLRRIAYYTFVDNDTARLTFIKCVTDYEIRNKTILSTKQIHRLLTHLSCLSNVSDVPTMDKNELYEYLANYIKEID